MQCAEYGNRKKHECLNGKKYYLIGVYLVLSCKGCESVCDVLVDELCVREPLSDFLPLNSLNLNLECRRNERNN